MIRTNQIAPRARFPRCMIVAGAVALVFCVPLAQDTWGALFQLIDDNSIVDGDTSNIFDPQTVTNWQVDGVDQLFQQGFWYRVGGGPEIKVSTLPIALEGTTDTNFDLFDDTLFVQYGGPGFDLEIRLTLDGGVAGSGSSDMGEQISIFALSNEAIIHNKIPHLRHFI